MPTAFLGTFGAGQPALALFAEYDALPNGHACGHNVASAFGYGLALALAASPDFNGRVLLFGTPGEEGIGRYASSKAIIAPHLKGLGVDVAYFAHPKAEWNIGSRTVNKSRKAFTFIGRATGNARPEDGVNALDAAVQFYVGLKVLRSGLASRYVVVHPAFSDRGLTPKLLIPERAEVTVEIKTDDDAYHQDVLARVRAIAAAAAKAIGARVQESDVTPFVASMKRHDLELTFEHAAERYLSTYNRSDVIWAKPNAGGAADIGNISQVVPTAYLGIKIGPKGVKGHSDEWRDFAGSKDAEEATLTGIAIGYEAALEYGHDRARSTTVGNAPSAG